MASEKLEKLKEVFDFSSIVEFIKNSSEEWYNIHKDSLKGIAKADVEAIVILGVIKAIPENVKNPDINVKKMQAAARLLELSAENNEKVKKLQDATDKFIKELINTVLKKLYEMLMAALVVAMA